MAGVLDELLQNVRQNDSDWKNAKNAIVAMGVPVPDGTPTSDYGEKILAIETGVDTSGDTVVPSALREGYTAHDAAGQEITGTIPDYSGGNTVEMTSPEGATLNTAGTYCEGDIEVVPKLQSKTATTGEIVKADVGYVGLSEVDTNPAFEAGKKSEYDAFWDVYQDYGNRTKYEYGFCSNQGQYGWTDETFRPKYDLILGSGYSGTYMFWGNYVSDVPAALERCGVVLDTRLCGHHEFMFAYTRSVRWGVIDASNSNSASYIWIRAKAETIEKFVVNENLRFLRSFDEANYLKNLTIEGTIGQGGLNLSWSPLSKDSLISVVNALSSTTTGLTVTLRLAAVNTAFETTAGAADGSTSEEWTALIATKPNWTINLINS